MKPDIVVLSEFWPPTPGGIQRALTIIAQDLRARLLVVAPGEPESVTSLPAEQRVRRSLFSGSLRPTWLWLVPWLWSQRNTRLAIFGHMSGAVTAAWFLRFAGRRFALLIHGQDVLSESRRRGRRWLLGSILRRAEWIGVNSYYTADLAKKYGVRSWRILRTHPAVPDSMLGLQSNPAKPVHLITICRLVPRKNVAGVLHALAELKHKGLAFRYDVVGEGPEKESLANLSKQLGLEAIVTWHGIVSDAKRNELLAAASVAVMVPKVLSQGTDVEGLGAFYLEAGAMGLPLVASDTGGISDIVQHGVNGFLVHPENSAELVRALETVITDNPKRHQFGQASRRLVAQEFTASIRLDRLRRAIDIPTTGPRISIVIPAYNSAATIAATLHSVWRQTYTSYEVIVVDDGSTDDLRTVTAPWMNRLKLISQSNQGAPAARNAGAAQVTGDYLLFLDADTILRPDCLASMCNTLRSHPEASFVYSNFRFGPKGFRLFEFSPERLRQVNYIHTSSLVRRRDFLGFDPNLKKFQDWDLWLTMAAKGQSGLWIDQELFRVQQRAGGMSTWLPSFVYRLPGIGQGHGSATIRSYRQAEQRIRTKHHLP